MSEPEQLALITEDGGPTLWLCPTCRGNRVMLRILYPSEVVAGDETAVEPCRTCEATGWLDFDTTDHSWCPY